MQIERLNEDGLYAHFTAISMGDLDSFTQDLKELSPNKLKEACKALEIPIGADKMEIIKAVVKKVTGQKKKPKEPVSETAAEVTSVPKADPPAADPPKEPKAKFTSPPGKKVKIVENPDFRKFIPRPKADDKKRLKTSIKEAFETTGKPLSEKLKVLPPKKASDPYILYDGHSRFEALGELGIPVTDEMIEINDLTPEQVQWEMIKLNVDRRHLTDAQKISLVDKFRDSLKKEVKEKRAPLKDAKKEAKKAAREARRAELAAQVAKVSEKRKKEAEEKAKKAKEAAAKAEEKAKEAEGEAESAREKVAEVAGVAPASVKLYEFCKKYAESYLKAEIAKGVEIGTIYGVVHDQWWNTVQAFDPKMIKDIKAGRLTLQDAFEIAEKNKPAEVYVPGPVETAIVGCKEAFFKVLKKKYGEPVTPDDYEADYINRLDARISKERQKSKK